jgi:xanthine dehydrogenase accessory factor
MPSNLADFIAHAAPIAIVEIAEAKGSTPREKGAWMAVSPEQAVGTIGGGQLEFLAIAKARELIAENIASGAMDIPLGPEIGQCCGGRVRLEITIADETQRAMLMERVHAEDAARPHIYIFGGGHVGHAMASALALLPAVVTVVETRAEELRDLPPSVKPELTSVPEAFVRAAPPGSAFAVLTHDHTLDFLIVAEALARDDAAYVGMIGSRTKKATFRNWYFGNAGGTEERFARLVSPIGGDAVRDKRPPVIAALAAAEIMTALVSSRIKST